MAQDNERLNAPYWRHDGYTLRRLRTSIEALTQTFFGEIGLLPSVEKKIVVDLGAGSAPYRSLFVERGCRYITCDIPSAEAVPGAADLTMATGSPVALDAEVA
ncbi:MAG: hypothetical protein H7232_14895, partial [Aeromicrobium sp.]|nr:hypothetical protein [Burkholderiales bacterium]